MELTEDNAFNSLNGGLQFTIPPLKKVWPNHDPNLGEWAF